MLFLLLKKTQDPKLGPYKKKRIFIKKNRGPCSKANLVLEKNGKNWELADPPPWLTQNSKFFFYKNPI